MHTQSKSYLVVRGWVCESKHPNVSDGDGDTHEQFLAPTLGEADAVFSEYVAKDTRTLDWGSHWARASVDIFETDGSPDGFLYLVKSYRSALPGS